MPTRNVNPTEHLDRFVEAGVTSRRFSNAREVVREGLRLPEQREEEDRARIEWLRGAVNEGAESIERGEGMEFESLDDLAAHIHEMGEEAAAEVSAELTRA